MALTQDDFRYLASLSCGKCKLQHEKVAYDRQTNKAIVNVIAEHGFDRVGLCPTAGRMINLTCAHTSSRTKLVNLLNKVPDEKIASEVKEKWIAQIKDIDFKIVCLDVQKSDSEIKHASLVKTKQESAEGDGNPAITAELTEVEATIEDIIAKYQVQVDAFTSLHGEINRALGIN